MDSKVNFKTMEIPNNKPQHKPQLMLFSGGRDSSLVAAQLMHNNIPLHLFTANNGCSVFGEPIKVRIDELKGVYGDLVVSHRIHNIVGTFREISLLQLEQDILQHKKNLILLGEKLAIHVHALAYCLSNGIYIMNDGLTKYQSRFAEQRDKARLFLEKFCASYNIEYKSPIYNVATSVDDVKNKLMRLGLSPKSLEGVTVFGSTFSPATDDVIVEYLESKLSTAKDILHYLVGNEYKNI